MMSKKRIVNLKTATACTKKFLRSTQTGYMLATFTLLLAITIPALIGASYFHLMNQGKNIQYAIFDTQLKWATYSTVDRIQLELRNLIDKQTLYDSQLFDVANNTTLNNSITDSIENKWFPKLQDNFKHNIKIQLESADKTPEKIKRTAQGIDYVKFCDPAAEPTICHNFAKTKTVSPPSGTASFNLDAGLFLSESETGKQSWGASELISVSISNLANYSMYLMYDLVTSPGSATTYEGPIYVNGNAYVTPNKDTTIRFTFDPTNFDTVQPTPYSLKVHQRFFWFGPRTTGPDPYNLLDANKYERDPYGAPVFYYFVSNNNPAWIDYARDGSANDGTSTIDVLSNTDPNPLNQQFTKLIGGSGSPSVPPVAFGIDPIANPSITFQRGRGEIAWRYTHDGIVKDSTFITTLHTWSNQLTQIAQTGLSTPVVTPSTAVETSDPYFFPKNPNWTAFLSNFKMNTLSFPTFEDTSDEQKLQLGGADANNPHVLVDLAVNGDTSNGLSQVKLEWLALNTLDPDSTGSTFVGIPIDFRQFRCNTPHSGCDQTTSDENPEYWMNQGPNTSNPFIKFANLNAGDTATFNNSIVKYYDERMKKSLYVIFVDIGRLKEFVGNPGIPQVVGPGHSKPLPTDKSIFVYIGLPEDTTPQALHLGGITFDSPTIYNSVIRIVNAHSIPDKGLTIASNGFVQIQGDYNTESTNNASCNNTKPAAAIYGDQIMLLSKSWIDLPAGNAPSTYTDPFDGFTYPSPRDSNGNTFSGNTFSAHPIRCNIAANCADVTVNAMLIGGDTPNVLKRYTDIHPPRPIGSDGGMAYYFHSEFTSSEDYWSGGEVGNGGPFRIHPDPPISGDVPGYTTGNLYNASNPDKSYAGNWFAHSRGNTTLDPSRHSGGAYLRKKYVLRQNDIYSDNPADAIYKGDVFAPGHLLDQADPIKTPPEKHLPLYQNETAYNNMPVYLVSYDAADNPVDAITHGAPYTTPIGTVGTLFDGAHCPSCNGDIPLFLKVDENGNIMHGPNMEDFHIKPIENVEDISKMGTLYQGSNSEPARIKPGERFAALATHDETIYPGTNPGTGLLNHTPLIVPDLSYTPATCAYYQADHVTPCTPNWVPWTCATGSTHCGTTCCNLPCGSGTGGENTCAESPKCQDSLCNSADTNNCQQVCTVPALAGIQQLPKNRIVYTVGGTYRLAFRDQNHEYWFQYIPYSVQMYNGGLENVVRLSEDWEGWNCPGSSPFLSCTPSGTKNSLTINGALDVLWHSKSLVDINGKQAYWSSTYTAPNRTIKYATQLKKDGCKPPGLPNTIQINSEGFKQE